MTSQLIQPAMSGTYGKYLLWLVLALPSFGMLLGVVRGAASPRDMLYPTGEFAVRMMIVAMAAGPLAALFPRTRLVRWLLRRRQSFGVAAFGYALLQTAYYLLDKAIPAPPPGELREASIWTGWIAFLLFVPLALDQQRFVGARIGRTVETLAGAGLSCRPAVGGALAADARAFRPACRLVCGPHNQTRNPPHASR